MQARKSLISLVCLCALSNGALAQQASSLDITFNPGSGAAGAVLSVALATNGDVLIGGEFTSVNGQPRTYVARLKPDGSLDSGFLPGQGPDSYVSSVATDPSGNLYIGGTFQNYSGIPRKFLARLRDDASLDLSWPNVVFDSDVSVIRPQQDGRLMVLGDFTHVNGMSRWNLARLNTDASMDASFNPALCVTDGAIYAFVVQPDGNVIIAGSFTTNSPVSRQYIARVSQSGILDSTFNAGYITVVYSGYYPVTALALQPDGKVIVSGSFTSINGYSRNGIARLNTNGTVDTSCVLLSGISNPFGAAVTVHT
jgi:uncharacterized delta-60 repeat protein